MYHFQAKELKTFSREGLNPLPRLSPFYYAELRNYITPEASVQPGSVNPGYAYKGKEQELWPRL